MDRDIVVKLRSSFETMVQKHPDTRTEYWCARDLQMLLGYAQWRSFEAVIEKAILSCNNAGYDPADHFARLRKMVDLGSSAKREIDDIALTRYPCAGSASKTRTISSTPVLQGGSLPVRMRRGDRRRVGDAAAGQECRIPATGPELVALRRHADESPERPGVRRRVRRYNGCGSFLALHYGERS